MEKYINLIFVSFSSAVSIKLLPLLEKLVQPDLLALFIACGIGAITFGALNFIYDLPKKFRQVRVLLDPIHGIEGYWFEEIENTPDHPYSFAWIEWNHHAKSFRYRGVNFNQDLTINARWRSRTINVNKIEEKIEFSFAATIVKNAQDIEGYGTLEFFNPIRGCYYSGTGIFLDRGTQITKYTLTMNRVDDDFIKNILGNKKVKNEDDIKPVMEAKIKDRQRHSPPID
jgi:hypothetical protein